MPFPSQTDTQATGLARAQRLAGEVRRLAIDAAAQMSSGAVSANLITNVYSKLVKTKQEFAAIASLPGIGQYAKDQFNDTGLDIGAEFTAMLAAIDGAISRIATDFPKEDVTGYILKDKLDAGGVSVRTFSSVATAGIRTELDNIVSTIS